MHSTLAPTTDLPARLKRATQALHAQTERAGAMAELLGGRMTWERYAVLLIQLRALYGALEEALDQWMAAPPPLAELLHELRRGPALDDDLASWAGATPAVARAAALLPAAQDYVHRLQRASATAPHTLAAHAYVRYLGDLHGGQVLARRLRRQFALAKDSGTRFYDFGDEATVRSKIARLRLQLAQLALTPAQADAVVAEAVWAFEAHCRLFEQMAGLQPADATRQPVGP